MADSGLVDFFSASTDSAINFSGSADIYVPLFTSPPLFCVLFRTSKTSKFSPQITVYKINEKNNLELDLAILSALLKGEV